MTNYPAPALNFPDQLARLPAAAQRKYRKLVAELEDTRSLLKNTMERETEVEARGVHLSRAQQRAVLADPERAARLGVECDQVRADYEDLFSTRARLEARRGELDNLTARLRHNEIPNLGWLVPVHVEAKTGAGEGLVGAVERVRGELYAKQGELAATRQAPLPRDELMALARTTVNDLAFNGQPLVVTAGGTFKVQWDRISVPGYPAASDNYVPRLFATLFPEEIYQLLVNQIPDVRGLSAAERREREAELERQILQLEHEEESLVVQAQAKGLDVARRRDASAYALLGCDPGHWHVPVAEAAE